LIMIEVRGVSNLMKTKMWYRRSQGQSLVLVALMAIVLVAFVGLAIDGGMAFSQRRAAQNAADGASLRGAYLMRTGEWRTQTDQTIKRDMVLTIVNSMAELHGVPDTNGSPNDAVNGNVVAYYRDADGEVPTVTGNVPCANDCPVIGTSPIPVNAWGVEVDVELPFDSYFIGVIGWNEITVAAGALAVAHVGPEASNNAQWVLFAKNEQNCDAYPNDSTHAIDLGGATNQASGNIHSNGDIAVSQAQIQQPLNAELSHRLGGDCTGCGGSRQRATAEIGVVLPSFDEYYTLVDEQTQITGVGNRYDNLPTPPGYTRPTLVFNQTLLGSDGLTNEPYTFIDGDLFITSTNTTLITIAGIIVVNGNVTISAPRVTSAALGVSILATGSIRTTAPNTLFNMVKPYQSTSYDPMLTPNRHVTTLWSNADYSTNGGDVCNTPVIDLSTPGWIIKGAVLGPKGRIVTTSTGSNKQVNGSIIGDTIVVSGSGQRFLYNSSYFPPQPDIIELME
jgi:hypothetical protein